MYTQEKEDGGRNIGAGEKMTPFHLPYFSVSPSSYMYMYGVANVMSQKACIKKIELTMLLKTLVLRNIIGIA